MHYVMLACLLTFFRPVWCLGYDHLPFGLVRSCAFVFEERKGIEFTCTFKGRIWVGICELMMDDER